MKKLVLPAALLTASPAFAAGEQFFSLSNTDFVVLLAFLLFVAVLVYFKVPTMLGKMLDDRAEGIRKDLDEARALREEAQELLASYERKQRDVQAQADRIVSQAKADAEANKKQALADLDKSIERRIAAAEEQIAAAEGEAVREVRERAIAVAVAAARDVIAGQMSAEQRSKLIDQSIDTVDQKLH